MPDSRSPTVVDSRKLHSLCQEKLLPLTCVIAYLALHRNTSIEMNLLPSTATSYTSIIHNQEDVQ